LGCDERGRDSTDHVGGRIFALSVWGGAIPLGDLLGRIHVFDADAEDPKLALFELYLMTAEKVSDNFHGASGTIPSRLTNNWNYPGFVESCGLGIRLAVGVSSCPPVA
jgi:hypothetical protein